MTIYQEGIPGEDGENADQLELDVENGRCRNSSHKDRRIDNSQLRAFMKESPGGNPGATPTNREAGAGSIEAQN
jgi:hypothetical protein